MSRQTAQYRSGRPPFWLASSNYYVMTTAASTTVFFLVWGGLNEGTGQSPWIPAGVAASATLFGGVVLRQIILRKIRGRIEATAMLERNLRSVGMRGSREREKLTIEQNSLLLGELRRKSEAALALSNLAASHREVFEFCEHYLSLNRRELSGAGPGSPRIAALRKGRRVAEELHERHMLKWAEIEARNHFADAQRLSRAKEKLDTAKRALEVIVAAAGFYPNDRRLAESAEVIRRFITEVNVNTHVERAERSLQKGDMPQARKHYGNALAMLRSDQGDNVEKSDLEMMIERELDIIDNENS